MNVSSLTCSVVIPSLSCAVPPMFNSESPEVSQFGRRRCLQGSPSADKYSVAKNRDEVPEVVLLDWAPGRVTQSDSSGLKQQSERLEMRSARSDWNANLRGIGVGD